MTGWRTIRIMIDGFVNREEKIPNGDSSQPFIINSYDKFDRQSNLLDVSHNGALTFKFCERKE